MATTTATTTTTTNKSEYPVPSGPRLVTCANLTPWAVMCIVGALRRDSEARSKQAAEDGDKTGALKQIADDELALSRLISALDSADGIAVYPIKINVYANAEEAPK